MLDQQRCSSCRARILWAVSLASGKPMPLDLEQKVGGNVDVIDGVYARVVPAAERTRPLYVSHFATCPDAGEHRRREAVPK
jgi:hypothetical protein